MTATLYSSHPIRLIWMDIVLMSSLLRIFIPLHCLKFCDLPCPGPGWDEEHPSIPVVRVGSLAAWRVTIDQFSLSAHSLTSHQSELEPKQRRAYLARPTNHTLVLLRLALSANQRTIKAQTDQSKKLNQCRWTFLLHPPIPTRNNLESD